MIWDYLWNSLWGWLGLGGAIVAGALAVAWFFPPLRNIALTVAAGVAGAVAIYTKGSADAARRKQKEWDDAENRMVDKGNQARADAERAVDRGGLPDDDEFDRDARKVRRP